MVGNPAGQIEPAKPAVGQVQVNLFAQSPLRPDPEAIPNKQHPDHRFRIDRGPSRRTVERRQMQANARQIDQTVNRSQQVAGRDVILERELVEQSASRPLPRTHHRNQPPRTIGKIDSAINQKNNHGFSTKSARRRSSDLQRFAIDLNHAVLSEKNGILDYCYIPIGYRHDQP